jgi:Flp pilus assembly protein TadG
MNLNRMNRIKNDTGGAILVEAAITLPTFILLMFLMVEVGLALWTQAGLQHGVDMAARCAAVNPPSNTCDNVADIKNFATTQSLGLNPPASTFTVTLNTTCGANGNNGNRVTASYAFSLFGVYISSLSSLTLTAQSCYPVQPG